MPFDSAAIIVFMAKITNSFIQKIIVVNLVQLTLFLLYIHFDLNLSSNLNNTIICLQHWLYHVLSPLHVYINELIF